MVVEWWNLVGKFKLLYKFNLVCICYICDKVVVYFGCDVNSYKFFEGFCILDIGCGGGLFFEFMVWMGVIVIGVDVFECNIGIVLIYVV